MEPGKHQRSKQRCQNLCWRSKTVYNFFFPQSEGKNCCVLCSKANKSEQKHTTRNFAGFHNHSSLLSLGARCNNLTWFKRKILSFSGLIPFRITYFPTDLKPLSLCQMLAIDNIFTDTRPTSKNLLRFLFPSQAFNLQIDITQVFTY